MTSIRVGIVGVGNCAASLVQGVHYYRNTPADSTVPGLMHVDFGGYHVADLEFVAAFDVDAIDYLLKPVEPARLRGPPAEVGQGRRRRAHQDAAGHAGSDRRQPPAGQQRDQPPAERPAPGAGVRAGLLRR